MELDVELYNQLRDLRMYIKRDGKNRTGIAPVVCSDETLRTITEHKPRRLEDFAGIPGVGDVFIKNYAQYFLTVIEIYEETEGEEKLKLTENAISVMRGLEENLVNINRRNRMIYMPRLYAKSDYDLFGESGADIIDFLFSSDKKSYMICDASDGSEKAIKAYKGLVTLLRETNRERNEKGINNLYVGYPFVIGRLSDSDFNVRCPLALFPVSARRSENKISISYDEARDVLFNRTLILAEAKLTGKEITLPEVAFEGCSIEEFIDKLTGFYKENGIQIEVGDSSLKAFCEYTKETFPKFNSNELHLEANAVLGRFSICDSAIQHDFDELIARGKINNFLAELLNGAEELEKRPWLNSELKVSDEVECTILDKDITYISHVDASQEKVLQAIKENDRIVVQGPPGTGKSQVITNLIAQFATEGKSVLLVSEKKTALNVVYSRLGEIAKYALLIDDVSNKATFYKQIAALSEVGTGNACGANEAFRPAEKIDMCFGMLDKINAALYKPDDFGIEPYKMFLLTKPDQNGDEGLIRANYLKSVRLDIPDELLKAKYPELKHMKNLLDQHSIKRTANEYMTLLKYYPFIANAKPGLNISVNGKMMLELQALAGKIRGASYRGFPELRLRMLKRPIRKFVNKYFETEQETVADIILIDPETVYDGLKNEYNHYYKLVDNIESYEPLVKAYIQTLYHLRRKCGEKVVDNEFLFDSIMRYHIDQFISAHTDEIEYVTEFKAIVRQLNQFIPAKMDYSREYLARLLGDYVGKMTYGKRSYEISKIANGTRKWNVNRFLNKYGFEIFGAIKIWLLTPEVVSEIIPLNTGIFDLVIFDEASQMYVEKGIPAIYRAKKIVIAGDSKQLRPSSLGVGRIDNSVLEDEVLEDSAEAPLVQNDSLLELGRYKYPDIWLNFHYRAKREELINFSNYAFYDGKLRVAPNVCKTGKPAIEYIYINDGRFIDHKNLLEAKKVIEILKEELKNKAPESTIGVITFNAAQRDLILDLIDEECDTNEEWRALFEHEMNRSDSGEDKSLFVKNVESVQGDERDIIIFSIGYGFNEEGKFSRNFGWLSQKDGENRLNVAISRAKRKEYVVASFMPEKFDVEGVTNDGPKYLKKFLEYAKCVSNERKDDAQRILDAMCAGNPNAGRPKDTDMSEFIFKGLKAKLPKQYEVKKNPTVCEDGIELIIARNGKTIAGIEYDTTIYKKYPKTRERDFHRYRFLSSRGWTILRVFAILWWNDPEGVLDELISQIMAV